MTTDTLAKLAAELAQLASEGPALIHLQSGAYICRKLGEAAKALAAQALPAAGRCDECGKDQAEGWALYCVGCLEKTGLLAKEALPSAQHVSSTAADLTGPNDTAAQATTGAPSEPFGYFKAQPFGWTDCAEDDDGAVALYERPQQAAQAPAGWREQHDRDSAELRSLCHARDEARRERDLGRVEIAGLNSSVGHLSNLVDHQASLLALAMLVMKTLHEAATPDDSNEDMDAIMAELYEQVRKFSPREFQALWTKNVTSGAMFDDLVRAAIASEAGK